MISSGEIDPDHPVDTSLVHRFRQEIVSALWENVLSDCQFFLKHPDDKGDHILVNDSFDIVGAIDWEWTQTVSKAEAFSSPCKMWPVAKFYRSSNELDADELPLAAVFCERGREDLANCVVGGRKVQRLFFALGTESSFLDMQTLSSLFAELRRAFDFEDMEWEVWKSKAFRKWREDGSLLGLLAVSE
ncbi:hypothetical protein NUU61_004126 [Penicillium alfredii]|uniref:Aminoglycoside phosphotransferase domain-containing protein n=1 Tax=Penicillium alfredii TaxID=1506179 RepID=A0A9W9FKJ4_9EURO|nr:uncharacterized protein NUU61_004126 [Penicillium alfredii]KAJ5101904.1 hypothetical protein NUU61_004126 [Penicillium alfredii]